MASVPVIVTLVCRDEHFAFVKDKNGNIYGVDDDGPSWVESTDAYDGTNRSADMAL
jgi:hypothetical protein